MTINKKLFNEVADAIENEPGMYNQSAWGNLNCKTPGCLAGWSVYLKGDTLKKLTTDKLVENAVRYLFIVPPEQHISKEFLPAIFYTWWPVSWFIRTGINIQELTVLEKSIQPNARHAVIICRAIADGKISEYEVLYDKAN